VALVAGKAEKKGHQVLGSVELLFGQDAEERAPGHLGKIGGIELGAKAAVEVAADQRQDRGAEEIIKPSLGLRITLANAVEQVEERRRRETVGVGHRANSP
jgi:hypothetical protein